MHVCQRWRYLGFESPIRLNLQLFCKEKSPVKKLLDVWPTFPLVIQVDYNDWSTPEDSLFDSLVAALERRDRVRRIDIANPPNSLWRRIVLAMQGPFPALRFLSLKSRYDVPHLLPDTFLSGYAPCLQDPALGAISSPSLPRFLSSTSDLTSLRLFGIIYSYSHCTQPETVATCLSALRRLKSLKINFVNAQPLPQRGNRASLPPTRFVLSALSELDFTGVSKYLEALAARIEAPLLDEFHINFSHHELVFDIPQTIRLFGHLDSSRPSSLILEFVQFRGAYISFPSRHSRYPSSWIYTCQ